MGLTTVLIAVSVLLNALSISAILCNDGYSVQSEFLNDDQIRAKQCQADEQCFRGEATANFIIPMNLVVGACVTPTQCEWGCDTLVTEAAREFFSLSGDKPDVRKCNKACCATDNCNAHSLTDLESNERPSARPTTLPTTTLPGASACYSGISNLSTGENTLMLSSSCPHSNSHCMRQEVTTMASSGALVRYTIASCINASTCAQPCSTVALDMIGDQTLSTRSCQMACCDFDDCNSLPIDVLSITQEEDRFPSPPAHSSLPKVNTAKITSTVKSIPSTTTTLRTTTTSPLSTTQPKTSTSPSTTQAKTTTSSSTTQARTTTSSSTTQARTTTSSSTTEARATASSPTMPFTTLPTSLSRSVTTRIYSSATDPLPQTTAPYVALNPDTSAFVVSQTRPVLPYASTMTCFVGHDITLLGKSSWSLTTCPSWESYGCLRQELLVELMNGTAVNVTLGNCANETACLDSCKDLVTQQLQNEAFDGLGTGRLDISLQSFTSCQMRCCRSKGCNKNTIEQLQNEAMETHNSTKFPIPTLSSKTTRSTILPTTTIAETAPTTPMTSSTPTTVTPTAETTARTPKPTTISVPKNTVASATEARTLPTITTTSTVATTGNINAGGGAEGLSINKSLTLLLLLLCLTTRYVL